MVICGRTSASQLLVVVLTVLLCSMNICMAEQIWPEYKSTPGSLPQQQNWTLFDVNEPGQPAVVDNILRLGPTSDNGLQGWFDRLHVFCFDSNNVFVLTIELKVVQSDYAVANQQWHTGFGIRVYDHTGRFVYVGIAPNGIRMTHTPLAPESGSTSFFSYNLRENFSQLSLYIYNGKARLAIDGQEHAALSLPLGKPAQGDQNLVALGDYSASASCEVLIKSFAYYSGNGPHLKPGFKPKLADFAPKALQWIEPNCQCPDLSGTADLNRDGRVDILDLDLICRLWF